MHKMNASLQCLLLLPYGNISRNYFFLLSGNTGQPSLYTHAEFITLPYLTPLFHACMVAWPMSRENQSSGAATHYANWFHVKANWAASFCMQAFNWLVGLLRRREMRLLFPDGGSNTFSKFASWFSNLDLRRRELRHLFVDGGRNTYSKFRKRTLVAKKHEHLVCVARPNLCSLELYSTRQVGISYYNKLYHMVLTT